MGRLAALTGSGGFVGEHVLAALVAAGWDVKALVRRSRPSVTGSQVRLVEGTLQSPPALDRLLEGVDVVIHCAGVTRARNSTDFEETNVAGTAALVAAVLRQSRRPRFLLVSSLAAREPGLSAYASSKFRAESALRQQAEDLDWLVVRPPAVYGPRDTATLPLFRQFERGFLLGPRGDDRRFSLIYIGDLASAIVTAARDPCRSGIIAELHDGKVGGYSWPDLAASASKSAGRSVRFVGLPNVVMKTVAVGNMMLAQITGAAPMLTTDKVREAVHRDWVCNGILLDSLIDWRPKVRLVEGFARTVAWYKDSGWL